MCGYLYRDFHHTYTLKWGSDRPLVLTICVFIHSRTRVADMMNVKNFDAHFDGSEKDNRMSVEIMHTDDTDDWNR